MECGCCSGYRRSGLVSTSTGVKGNIERGLTISIRVVWDSGWLGERWLEFWVRTVLIDP